jgi:DMSO reductase family type II enzyme chaperone
MFVYSLSGLSLAADDAGGPVEVEENETTARSAVYQWLGRVFTAPDVDHFERARDGRWAKELAAAAGGLPYAFDVPLAELPAEVDQQSYEAAFAAALDGRVLGGAYGGGDRERALEDIHRAYEYFGLTASDRGLPPDHLVSECDYLQYLTFREAAVSSDRLRRSYRRAQLEFLDQHLVWTSALAAESDGPDRLAFIGWATLLLASFVVADAAYVRELVGG